MSSHKLSIEKSEKLIVITPRFLLAKIVKLMTSSLYNNAFYIMLNNISTSLLGFVFWNIMTRTFQPAEIGIGSALLAASGLLASVANMGLGVGLIRFLPTAGKKAMSIINVSFTLAGVIAMLGSMVYLAGLPYWAPVLAFVRDNLLMSSAFIIFTGVSVITILADQTLVAGRLARYVFMKNAVTSIIKIPLPIFVFYYLKGYGIFAGTGIALIIGMLLAWFWFIPTVYEGYVPRPAWSFEIIKKILPFSFVNNLVTLFNNSTGFIYQLMALNFLGSESNAYLYIAWMMTTVLTIIPAGLAQSLFAEGSHNPGKIKRDGRNALFFALFLSIPASVLMILLGGWLLKFFGSEYAQNGTGIIRFLALAVIPRCVTAFYLTTNQIKHRLDLILIQTGTLFFIAIGLGYWLMKEIGLTGLGVAYTTANLIVAVAVIAPLWKELGHKAEVEAESSH
ncbi:MAG: oligosaccharide flippase family protein [Spirochaetes bacterium]|nr:oligosaccharide flippase family protein [Spirochaetota bacterium]